MGVLVVTGGGRGIGAAVCRQAAAAGYQVVINYASDEDSARTVLAEIEAAGGSGLTVAGDVASEQDVARIFAAADPLGPLSGLVSNAGVTGNTPGRLDEQDAGVVRRVLDVNVLGVFLCNREAVRRMSTPVRRHGRGDRVMREGEVGGASTAAGRGSPGEWVHYAASKAPVDSLTHGLALEVAAEGIRVNAVAPGLVHTDLHAAAGLPDRLEQRAPLIPMRRAGQPEVIAAGIMWLLSPAASFVNGAVLPIAGGF